MNNKIDTGCIIHANAASFGNELCGIKAAVELIRDAVTYKGLNGEWPNWMDESRMDSLLGMVGASADASYKRLIRALGSESPMMGRGGDA